MLATIRKSLTKLEVSGYAPARPPRRRRQSRGRDVGAPEDHVIYRLDGATTAFRQSDGYPLVRDVGRSSGMMGHAGTRPESDLLRVHNRAMTSMDAAAEVLRLHAKGLSIRAIAELTGLSKSTVHRILAAVGTDFSADDPDDLDGVALLDTEDADVPMLPPFVFVGMEPVVLEQPGCDGGQPAWEERFLDAHGRSCTRQDVYRARAELEERDDYDAAVVMKEDVERQIAEAGWRRVWGERCWHWERVDNRTGTVEHQAGIDIWTLAEL